MNLENGSKNFMYLIPEDNNRLDTENNSSLQIQTKCLIIFFFQSLDIPNSTARFYLFSIKNITKVILADLCVYIYVWTSVSTYLSFFFVQNKIVLNVLKTNLNSFTSFFSNFSV